MHSTFSYLLVLMTRLSLLIYLSMYSEMVCQVKSEKHAIDSRYDMETYHAQCKGESEVDDSSVQGIQLNEFNCFIAFGPLFLQAKVNISNVLKTNVARNKVVYN